MTVRLSNLTPDIVESDARHNSIKMYLLTVPNYVSYVLKTWLI